jgi:hypothetical protein
MKNPFQNSSRDSMPRQSENMKKEIHVLYDDPIIFGKVPDPREESAPPPSISPGTPILLIGGLLVGLLCLWWFAPEWLAAAWKNLIAQIIHFVGHPPS